ncbi:hypothetical protein CC2G_015296 [Coprinopsis cinerea AmutBmut pab1-1]|nr:hypothetical protein CC2G_015296 [Coprinopsis cinerea AmutBmut pab1-1]
MDMSLGRRREGGRMGRRQLRRTVLKSFHAFGVWRAVHTTFVKTSTADHQSIKVGHLESCANAVGFTHVGLVFSQTIPVSKRAECKNRYTIQHIESFNPSSQVIDQISATYTISSTIKVRDGTSEMKKSHWEECST